MALDTSSILDALVVRMHSLHDSAWTEMLARDASIERVFKLGNSPLPRQRGGETDLGRTRFNEL